MDIRVIGAGAWGTALAINAARHGHVVTLWARDAAQAQAAAREAAEVFERFNLDLMYALPGQTLQDRKSVV
jgi:glycerol-3-phosphate dehydrogenase (NAD(P)+)